MRDPRVTLNVRRNLANPEPPTALHQARYSRVGSDILLEVGYFDLPELRDAMERARNIESAGNSADVTLHVTHRFSMSPQGVRALAHTVQRMLQDLQASGMLQAEAENDVAVS